MAKQTFYYKRAPDFLTVYPTRHILDKALSELYELYDPGGSVNVCYVVDASPQDADIEYRNYVAGLHIPGDWEVMVRMGPFSRMLRTLAHEYRHFWQFETLKRMNQTPQEWMRDHLESDAEKFASAFAGNFIQDHLHECFEAEIASELWIRQHPTDKSNWYTHVAGQLYDRMIQTNKLPTINLNTP